MFKSRGRKPSSRRSPEMQRLLAGTIILLVIAAIVAISYCQGGM
jgi:hypothetical protein